MKLPTPGPDALCSLAWLLADERWRALGAAAQRYVAETYGVENAVAQHIAVYREAVLRSARRRPEADGDQPSIDGRQPEAGDL